LLSIALHCSPAWASFDILYSITCYLLGFTTLELSSVVGLTNKDNEMLYNANLSKTKNGRSFDGSIRKAHVGKGVLGRVYQATPRFNDGDFISTSEVVNVDFIPSTGWFVETINGSRYHIASTEQSAAQKGIVEADMKLIKFYIDTNSHYFKPLQWS